MASTLVSKVTRARLISLFFNIYRIKGNFGFSFEHIFSQLGNVILRARTSHMHCILPLFHKCKYPWPENLEHHALKMLVRLHEVLLTVLVSIQHLLNWIRVKWEGMGSQGRCHLSFMDAFYLSASQSASFLPRKTC